MTYGDKYALMKAYKISTGDDPDQNASVEEDYRPAGNRKPPAESGAFVPTCAKCGAEISIAEHDYSVKGWKRPLCRKCQREEPRK
jgi:ribosomal protein S27AE